MARQITLMDRTRIERSLKRIAIQIWENFKDSEIIVIGLNERGFATAKTLFDHLSVYMGDTQVELAKCDVKNLPLKNSLPNCTEKNVVLVDDVIFSGKTMFDALTAVCSTGNPNKIQTVALVDRGHRRYPIQADLVGIHVPTKFGEHIEVMLSKKVTDQVILFKN